MRSIHGHVLAGALALFTAGCLSRVEPDPISVVVDVGFVATSKDAASQPDGQAETDAGELGAESFDALFNEPVQIDVGNVDGVLDPRRSEIIVRAGETTIEWGRAPLTDRMRIAATTKLQRLQTLIERDEDLTRLSLIRLQFDDVEWVER